MRKRSYDNRTSRWRKPQSLTAFRAPTPSAAIVRQSMNSLTGTALRRDYRLARPWWSGTECTWNRGTWRQAQSISASVRYAALHTRQRTGLLSADLAAGIRRVRGVKKLGVRLGNWLTPEQGKALWQAPDRERLKGKRDRALLALLLACGLRRHEAVTLTLDHLQQREDHWAIVDLVGKAGHVRTVPVPDWVKCELQEWLNAASIDRGKLFRRVNKVGRTWGDGMTEKSVWHIVKESAKAIGLDKLAPHDLRRTCARLCHALGGELEQIQFLLGHMSVQTTERYLGCKQRIQSAVNDRIGIEPQL